MNADIEFNPNNCFSPSQRPWREIFKDEGGILDVTIEGWFTSKNSTGGYDSKLGEVHLKLNKEEYFESVRKRISYNLTPTDGTYWTFTLNEEEK